MPTAQDRSAPLCTAMQGTDSADATAARRPADGALSTALACHTSSAGPHTSPHAPPSRALTAAAAHRPAGGAQDGGAHLGRDHLRRRAGQLQLPAALHGLRGAVRCTSLGHSAIHSCNRMRCTSSMQPACLRGLQRCAAWQGGGLMCTCPHWCICKTCTLQRPCCLHLTPCSSLTPASTQTRSTST